MSRNVLSLTRLVSNAAVVAVLCAFLAALAFGNPDGRGWAWIIGATALAGAAAQFVVSILRPSDIRPSWDEQVQASHRASLVFGYWITLATFLVFLALVLADVMSVDLAFYALGFPLGFAPAVWMLGAHLAGRAG